MTTSILNKKKTTKTAKMKNETLLRAKTMQRAAILFGCDRAGARDYAAFLGFFSLDPS